MQACELDKDADIPDEYDFRKDDDRKVCVSPPRNSGNCTASHVLTTVSTVEDRICIQLKGKKVRLSAQDVLSCDSTNYGCEGGYVTNALKYGMEYGFVEEDCYKWSGTNSTCPDEENKCRTQKKQYPVVNYCVVQGEDAIKREVLKNGPVIAPFHPYTDFLTYKDGVYTPSDGSFKFNGQLAVKIVGWGKKESLGGTGYWILENTWDSDWGIGGYAHIIAG